jgi:Predicted dehydrogenases and related proteins
VTTARTDTLIRAAADAGVTLGVIFQDRLKPDVQRMKTLIERGRLGTPILANARVNGTGRRPTIAIRAGVARTRSTAAAP